MPKFISAEQFHAGLGADGWHVLYGGAQAVFPTDSFALGVKFIQRIADEAAIIGREPDIDLRPEAVVVRTASSAVGQLDATDMELAERVSAVGRELGIKPDPSKLHTMQIAVAEADQVKTRDFWVTALGYVVSGGFIVDPLRRGPRMWFDEIGTEGRGRTHIDIAVPHERAEAHVTAILAAGGRLADGTHAPAWWTLASPDNHGLDIVAWVDVDSDP